MKKNYKWISLLAMGLLFLTGCGQGPITSESSGLWNQLIYGFGQIIQALSLNGQVGIGIILFTILIRTLLLPLFQMQMTSARKMQELQPQLKALQEQYAGTDLESKQALQEATSRLYKENGVKLSASTIPILIQLPILLALFRALTSIEALRVGHFYWMNLAEPDHLYILPVLAALFTFLSMWLSNKAAPEKNRALVVMNYAMPLMIFGFALTSASGVALYWTVSNAYQVFQILLLNNPFKIVAQRQAKQEAERERQAKIRRAQKKARKKR